MHNVYGLRIQKGFEIPDSFQFFAGQDRNARFPLECSPTVMVMHIKGIFQKGHIQRFHRSGDRNSTWRVEFPMASYTDIDQIACGSTK